MNVNFFYTHRYLVIELKFLKMSSFMNLERFFKLEFSITEAFKLLMFR